MSVLVHVGQCGNQLGDAFWRLTADAKETLVGSSSGSGSPSATGVARQKKPSAAARAARSAGTQLPLLYADNFFHRGSRRARCILVDTEPKVIHAMLHGSGSNKDGRLEPAHVHFEQSGRGNNWAMGYNLQTHQRNVLRTKSGTAVAASTSTVGVARTTKKKLLLAEAAAQASDKRELVELVMESLRHEIEALDAYRGTVLMHSLGGGTGAGLGCRLLETIRDVYPRSYLGAVSVAPSCASGDTPLQNYNALFTLQHLQEHTDFVVYKENDELMRAASYWKAVRAARAKGAAPPREADGVGKVTLREMNALVAADIAGAMFPIVRKGVDRGLVAQPFDMAKLVHDCCPLPTAKFLDTRTGVLRDSSVNSNNAGSAGVDPLFHGVPRSIGGGEEEDAAVAKLMRYTTQSSPRWTSASRAIGATVVVRQSSSMFEEAGLSEDVLARSLSASLPRLHLGNRIDISQSAFAPFPSHGGKASTTITLNNGHATASIEHYLDRGRRQLQARAYIHWYKQYGLEDADFESAFEQCTKIARNYDELLHP